MKWTWRDAALDWWVLTACVWLNKRGLDLSDRSFGLEIYPFRWFRLGIESEGEDWGASSGSLDIGPISLYWKSS